ncbi:MAG: hypothetical protein JXB88_05290 [Spirochaetales bacterium]|nr:hypothetical protein [Spirochaetales bacterium]
MKKCPLCGTSLKTGERVFTEAFPGKEEEKIVYLHGCPYCKGKKPGKKKECPVCKKVLPQNGYLIGKMWDPETGKTRVHISCCSICRRKHVGEKKL